MELANTRKKNRAPLMVPNTSFRRVFSAKMEWKKNQPAVPAAKIRRCECLKDVLFGRMARRDPGGDI
jgi:hypothetical protein